MNDRQPLGESSGCFYLALRISVLMERHSDNCLCFLPQEAGNPGLLVPTFSADGKWIRF